MKSTAKKTAGKRTAAKRTVRKRTARRKKTSPGKVILIVAVAAVVIVGAVLLVRAISGGGGGRPGLFSGGGAAASSDGNSGGFLGGLFGGMSVGFGGGGLSGTWVSDIATETSGFYGKIEMTFRSGNWEAKIDGTPIVKGTYTASGNTYTETTTHLHGALFKEMAGNLFDIESKWYTRAQWKATTFGEMMGESPLDELFGTQTGTYTISGNKLTMPGKDGKPYTLTRK